MPVDGTGPKHLSLRTLSRAQFEAIGRQTYSLQHFASLAKVHMKDAGLTNSDDQLK